MIKRTIYIGNPAFLSLKQAQMLVELDHSEEGVKTVPIEDIGMLVLDHPQATLTHGLSNALIANNVAILWCDAKHMPHGLVLPLSGNDVFTEKLRCQLDASAPLKKQLWKQTVEAKVLNQAAILDQKGLFGEKLRKLAAKVQSGDPENIEGRAAAFYWDQLLQPYQVTRGRFDGPPNHLLNYGYAVLRAVVARSLVMSGFLPALGIHHSNKYNPFCLADDVMEPYRPMVDAWVLKYLEGQEEIPEDLGKEEKAYLLQIPVLDVVIGKKSSPLMVAMQRTTAGLMRCFEGTLRKIPYPDLSS